MADILGLIQQGTSLLNSFGVQLPFVREVEGFINALPLGDIKAAAQGVASLAGISPDLNAQSNAFLTLTQTGERSQNLKVGNVVIQAVQVEEATESLETATHPKEDRRNITDHAWRMPTVLRVQGSLIGGINELPRQAVYNDNHKRALQVLRGYRERAELVNVVIDFPAGVYRDCLVKDLNWQRSMPWVNEYKLNITLEQQQFVYDPSFQFTLPDPSTGMTLEGPPQDMGLVNGDVFGLPGTKGDGGLGGLLNSLANLAGSGLKDLALSAAEGFLKNLPGGSLISGLLKGNISSDTLIESAIGLLPGGGLINTALSFVGGVGGVSKALNSAFSGESAESVVAGFAGSVVDKIAEKYPIAKGIAGVLGNFLRV